jgi:hypothetical protein
MQYMSFNIKWLVFLFADLKIVLIVQKHHFKQMGKDAIVHKIVYSYLVSTYIEQNSTMYNLVSIVYLIDNKYNGSSLYM